MHTIRFPSSLLYGASVAALLGALLSTSACAPPAVITPTGASPAASPAASTPRAGTATPEAVIRQNDVQRVLSAIADDSMEGRRTGTEGAHRAARYIAREMQAIGLTPAGDSGYFQRVPLAAVQRPSGPPRLRNVPDWNAYNQLAANDRLIDMNVVGILPGSDPTMRDSVILVDAHYDHLGVGRPVNGDSIYNGADDDGSGVVTVLEVARALAAGPRPKRSVVFLLTTGEELGLLGTNWYVAHPAVPLSRMVANLEIEMIGRPDSLAGGPGHAWLTGDNRSTMGASFRTAGLAVVPDPRPSQQFFTRSDNIAFAQAGIPAHTLSSFNLHDDYHQVTDEVSRVDFAHLTSVAILAAKAVRLLADGPAPVWNPGGKP